MQNGNTHAFQLPYSLQQFTVQSLPRWLLTFDIRDTQRVVTPLCLSCAISLRHQRKSAGHPLSQL